MVDNNSIIYATGKTKDGKILIGGIWTLWDQHGFPIEMSHLVCQDNNWEIDWLEVMADASITSNLPALMNQVEAFLDEGKILLLKIGFSAVFKNASGYEQVVQNKRNKGFSFKDFVYAAVVNSSKQTLKQY